MSARDYLRTGLELFHDRRLSDLSYEHFQVALGNLAISIELMIKAVLACKNLTLVLTDLPLELEVLCICPKDIKNDSLFQRFSVDLQSGVFKTGTFDECLSKFYLFFPSVRERLGAHMGFLSRHRNVCVHSAFPSFRRYELDRFAYTALLIFDAVRETDAFRFSPYFLSEKDAKFIADFEENRIRKVEEAITKAKEKAKSLNGSQLRCTDSDWEHLAIECPICGNSAFLVGYTNFDVDQVTESEYNPYLTFHANEFYCEVCGLKLDDYWEIHQAGMNTEFDYTGKLDQWYADEYGYDYM